MNTQETTKLVKLFSGEMIIGTVEEPTDSTPVLGFNIDLDNPRQVAIVPNMNGSMRVALCNVCEPFNVKRLKEFISIPKSQAMFVLDENEIDNQLVNGYKSEVSGIKIATSADAAALKNNSSPGDFKL